MELRFVSSTAAGCARRRRAQWENIHLRFDDTPHPNSELIKVSETVLQRWSLQDMLNSSLHFKCIFNSSSNWICLVFLSKTICLKNSGRIWICPFAVSQKTTHFLWRNMHWWIVPGALCLQHQGHGFESQAVHELINMIISLMQCKWLWI